MSQGNLSRPLITLDGILRSTVWLTANLNLSQSSATLDLVELDRNSSWKDAKSFRKESKSPLLKRKTLLRGLILGGVEIFNVHATAAWSLNLSGEWTFSARPGVFVKIRSSVLSSRVGKVISCSFHRLIFAA